MTTFALRAALLGAALATALCVPASAGVVNFDSHVAWTTGTVSGKPATGTTVLTNDFTSFAYSSQGITFGRAGLSTGAVVYAGGGAGGTANGICGLDASGNVVINCTGDQYFSFVTTDQSHKAAATDHLSFAIGDAGPDLDKWIIHVYDINDQELEARILSSVNFTTQSFDYSGISRVWVQWTGAAGVGGYFLDAFAFNTPAVPARVPEPASLALFGLGLAGLLSRRKRRA